MIRICFHGAESTGKSVLAERLRQRFGWPWVTEYGREYAETHGTDFTMDDLLAMARGQNEAMLRASEARPPVLILDTDPLMTAAWAQMLFGRAPQELFAYPKADLYLLFSPDVPWVADGTRFFGTDEARARFAAVAEEMLVRAGVPYARIEGDWEEREAQVVEAVKVRMPPAG
ncbi:ATP-binding protein [Novosphingobium sp. SG707]|uniref:AAA family ATPase n=1 Tax=Novosphingobium sp. SG707 TaxID=2586996 RepID=UPI001447D681|nr:ATP-binding protein [Novosphingobium sp. SG707]NKJ01950.1 NadR type nicotinamide-nucleotide adenylyltransferase [Novosphingobium sp. SG707]